MGRCHRAGSEAPNREFNSGRAGVLVFERSEARLDARPAEPAHVVVEVRVVHADGLFGGAVGGRADAQLLPGGRECHLQMCIQRGSNLNSPLLL